MLGSRIAKPVALVVIALALVSCDRIKSMVGMGMTTDFRNAQIDVAGTACSDNAKFSTLVLQNGKFELADYQFELFGETKHGDVSGHTAATSTDDAVFVGNCAVSGQTSEVLFVYGMDNGTLKRLGTADLSDNGKGLVQSYDVKDSQIVVEQNLGNPPTLSKTNYALLSGKLTDLSAPTTQTVAANTSDDTDVISYESFHEKLQPYGRWVQHPTWGWSWHPAAADFRPYVNGHWENSDEYGAVWVSADRFGDLPYHYGRWGYDPNYGGWLWVPGYVWAPSWVVWRAGDDNVGWLPIPPGAWDGEGDYPDDWDDWYGYRDLYGAAFDAAAFDALWSFAPSTEIFAPNIRERILDRRHYAGFMGRTRNFTRYGIAHGHVVNRAFEGRHFAETFHHGLPAGSRHDFAGRRVTPVAEGRRIAEHERLKTGGDERVHLGIHERGDHMGAMHQSGFGHAGLDRAGFGRGAARSESDRLNGLSRAGIHPGPHGFSRTQGVGHSPSGFSRTEGSGFGRSSERGFARTGGEGLSRTGGSANTGDRTGERSGGFSRSGGEGFSRSGGNAGGFGRSGERSSGFARSGGAGGGFGRAEGSGRPAFGASGGARQGGFGGGGFSRPAGGGFARPAGGGGGFARPAGGGNRPAPAPHPNNGNGHHH